MTEDDRQAAEHHQQQLEQQLWELSKKQAENKSTCKSISYKSA
jgi:hypothetical protein